MPYCHLVFTLPHELNALAAVHARWVYDTLMQCTAATLAEFAANPRWLGGTGAFTLVLHTWTQDLRRHLHVHALMACGALQPGVDGDGAWIKPKRSRNFLFPVHALSKVFRGKFMQALHQAGDAGALARDPAGTPHARAERVQALRRHDWVVYAKTPLVGPAAVLDYLARYTPTARPSATSVCWPSPATGCSCACALTTSAASAPSPCRASSSSAGCGSMCCMGHEGAPTWPRGFKRIRHYGLLAPTAKTERLALARRLLAMPAANAQAREDAQAFMRRVAAIDVECCPHCKLGRWRVVEQRGADRAAIAAPLLAACRGPP